MAGLLGDLTVRFRADLSNLSAGVSRARTELTSLSSAAQHSSSGLLSGFKSAGSGLLDFGSKVGMTVFGLKSLADGAVSLGQALLEPNASMEQTTVAFETLLGKGKATQEFLKQLQDFAASTPFEFPELAENAQHMLAFGFSAKEVIPTLTDIGDAMSAMGKSTAEIDQVVTVFGQMKAAGKVTADDMMQLTSQGIPAWKMLAEAMHLTIPEVRDLSEKGLLPADQAIKDLTAGMHKMFGGGMAAQAQTFNGLLSTLKDNVGAAMRAFTGPLFDQAKAALQKLGDLVSSKQFQDFAKMLGEQVGGALRSLIDWIGQAWNRFQRFASDVAKTPGFQAFLEVLRRVGEELTKFPPPGLKAFGDQIAGLFSSDSLKTGAKVVGDAFGLLAKGIDAASQAVKGIQNAWQQAQPLFKFLGDYILSTFKPVWDQLVWTWQNQLVPAWNQFMDALRPAMPALKFIGEVIGVVILGAFLAFIKALAILAQGAVIAFGLIVQALSAVITPVLNGLTAISDIVNWVINAWNALPGFFSNLWSTILAGLQAAWDNILAGIQAAWSGITGFFQGLWDGIVGIFQNAINTVVVWFQWLYAHNYYFQMLIDAIRNAISAGLAWLTGAWNGFVGWLAGLWNGLVGRASGAWNAQSNAISAAINAVIGWLRGAWNAAVAWLSGIWNSLVGKAQGIWNAITGVFRNAWGGISGALSTIGNGIASWIGGLANQAYNWGKNLIQGFINGIAAMVGAVGQAVSNVVSAAASKMGFHSPAKEGPGRDADVWGPNLIKMFASGIEAMIPQVRLAVGEVVRELLPLSSSESSAPSAPLPRGTALQAASLAAASSLARGQSQGGTLVLNIDGREWARAMYAQMPTELRLRTGVRSA